MHYPQCRADFPASLVLWFHSSWKLENRRLENWKTENRKLVNYKLENRKLGNRKLGYWKIGNLKIVHWNMHYPQCSAVV